MAGISSSTTDIMEEEIGNDAASKKSHQPRKFAFPKREYRKKTVVHRALNPSGFDLHNWLDYDESMDTVYCHVCKWGMQEKGVKSACLDIAFLSRAIVKRPSRGTKNLVATKIVCNSMFRLWRNDVKGSFRRKGY